MAAPLPQNDHNDQLNDSINKAVKHMLDAISCLQTVSVATVAEQTLAAVTHQELRAQVRRIAGRGGVQ